MILNLFPQRPDHPLADAKEFKRILAELLVERAENAIDEVSGWYESLMHARNFRLDHYFEIFRQLDDVAQPHLRRLARDYLYSPHLSAVEQQRLWNCSHNYLQAVAAGYSLCLQRAQLEPKAKGSEAFRPSWPLAFARVQFALGAQIRWRAYRYEPVGDDLWRSLGDTYLAADAAGHAQKSLALYPTQRGLSSTAQHYLQAVVFFTSSMDSLLPQQIELADRLIGHFLPGFVFSPECRPDSVYWVDADSAAGPARLVRHPGVSRPGLRFFSPGTALASLNELIQIVEGGGEVPTGIDLGGEHSQQALLPVLRHLRLYWALQPPQRRHRRHSVQTRMVVLSGFDHCYTVFGGVIGQLEESGARQQWIVENVSLGGLRARLDQAGGDRIKLGTLLCLQAEGGENWLLGVTRRLSRLPGERALVGVQVISRQACSINLRPRRSGFSAALGLPGICLRDGGAPGLVRIVLPPGAFNVRESLDFSRDGQSCVLTPVELEETGGDYQIARFREQPSG